MAFVFSFDEMLFDSHLLLLEHFNLLKICCSFRLMTPSNSNLPDYQNAFFFLKIQMPSFIFRTIESEYLRGEINTTLSKASVSGCKGLGKEGNRE